MLRELLDLLFGWLVVPPLLQLRSGLSGERFPAVVVVSKGSIGLHCGIACVGRGGLELESVVDLAFHHWLRRTPVIDAGTWAYVQPTVDPLDLAIVAQMSHCVADLAEAGEPPAYGFEFQETGFDSTGHLRLGPADHGLTCTTFVMSVFAYARVPLVDTTTWQTRDDDVEAQRQLFKMLRNEPRASRQHLQAVQQEIGCMRYRPEEILAASTLVPPQALFKRSARRGARLLSRFQTAFSRAP